MKESLPEPANVCEECVKSKGPWGDKDKMNWVSLRVCQTCGHVGCCDKSPQKHARAHYETTGHPIIKDVEATFTWCYEDDAYVTSE